MRYSLRGHDVRTSCGSNSQHSRSNLALDHRMTNANQDWHFNTYCLSYDPLISPLLRLPATISQYPTCVQLWRHAPLPDSPKQTPSHWVPLWPSVMHRVHSQIILFVPAHSSVNLQPNELPIGATEQIVS
ncbi:hypothetical protein AG1IA_08088 [Rhizoctonia solani AG-1 IA]|uniref:Uncharacterized protein n=1 Tax=Thanatephorus cucumeris (strain AG1-IA) TaxID=983506 RepID=L8WJ00_THACA|nr:hypothetical protein AG1IA_08088 [Rhizoctonia solani AG-1 IA]